VAIHHPITSFPTNINRDYFGAWLSGFVDGEGYFRLGYNRQIPVAVFGITLRADDQPILELIRSYLGCGKPVYIAKGQSRGNENPTAMFIVKSIIHLHENVVLQFRKYPLLAKKSNDFAIWKDGVTFLYDRSTTIRYDSRGRKHRGWHSWNQEHLLQFAEYVNALKETRQYQ